MTKNTTEIKQVQRLTEAVYDDLVRQLPPIVVNHTTTAHTAGYLLGVQYVLSVIRKGIVVQGPPD